MSSRHVYDSYCGSYTTRIATGIRLVYHASIRVVYRDRDRDTPTGVCLWCLWLLNSAAKSLYSARFSAA